MVFTTAQIARMRETFDASLQDSCQLVTVPVTINSYGEETPGALVEGEEIACGVEMKPGTERHNVDGTVTIYDAVIRLPITETPDVEQRIKVTRLYGETITPVYYEIVSPIQRGVAGIRVQVRKVIP